jgi:hypothetical protein
MTVRFALDICANLVGIPLEVLILVAMLRGAPRRYPALFLYMCAVFVASLVETPLYVIGHLNVIWHADRTVWTEYTTCYWIDEGVLMGLVFAVVLSLIYQATEKVRARRLMRTSVLAAAILFPAAAFWVHYDAAVPTGQWVNAWSSNLNFCAAILDLGLWAMLIAARDKDSRLLMFSGALGILFTGSAISTSFSSLAVARKSSALVITGGLVNIVSNQTFLYIWWQALRARKAVRGRI